MIRDSGSLALADERDRIFAFQSLARRITDTRFRPETPNYELSLWEAYLGFAKKYVSDTGDLSLLNFVHHNQRTIDEAPVSCCPQWNVVVYETGFVTNLERPQPSQPPRLFGDVLCVRGVIFDVVSAASEVLSKQTSLQDIAFADCLVVGNPLTPVTPRPWECHFAAYVRELARMSNDAELPEGLASGDGGDIAWAHFQVAYMIDKRRLVVTNRGYYGLVPGPSRQGDVVAVVGGALTPLILRETSLGNYRLVGEVYISSKAVRYSESGTREYKMLGDDVGSEDWRGWGGEEQDIFLV
ncbi:ankyrin and het domain protein [Colletotrichum plurivorum]|uniref:Ankyrin and het domain protein n=1 Tax=Colletotrichum plurivorum TaxID=2175906 RepID=A0A8H6J7E9_9PEZI|nr:ankyrin and het domain protein [Colletotrichum plurivorum]